MNGANTDEFDKYLEKNGSKNIWCMYIFTMLRGVCLTQLGIGTVVMLKLTNSLTKLILKVKCCMHKIYPYFNIVHIPLLVYV